MIWERKGGAEETFPWSILNLTHPTHPKYLIKIGNGMTGMLELTAYKRKPLTCFLFFSACAQAHCKIG